jgi:hypothetical protein
MRWRLNDDHTLTGAPMSEWHEAANPGYPRDGRLRGKSHDQATSGAIAAEQNFNDIEAAAH